jgi:hypothetical protein
LPARRPSIVMAALRNLKAVVMGCFIISYLVIGAFFALVFLVVPPALVLRPFARRAYYSFITVCFGNYWYSTIYILEQMTGTKVKSPNHSALQPQRAGLYFPRCRIRRLSHHACTSDPITTAPARPSARKAGLEAKALHLPWG